MLFYFKVAIFNFKILADFIRRRPPTSLLMYAKISKRDFFQTIGFETNRTVVILVLQALKISIDV